MVLPRSRERVGVKSGQGEFQLPHTHSSLSPLRLSLSLAQERRRRSSPDLHLRPLSSDFDWWDHSPPLPLAMEQGFSPIPPFFLFVLLLLGFGEMQVVLEILGQIYARVGCRRVVLCSDGTCYSCPVMDLIDRSTAC